jgi:hypothetical protein
VCSNDPVSTYTYTWKHEISILSKRSLEFRQPLIAGMIFVDLQNGNAYRVQSVSRAKDLDKVVSQMPDEVVQTFSAGTISGETSMRFA